MGTALFQVTRRVLLSGNRMLVIVALMAACLLTIGQSPAVARAEPLSRHGIASSPAMLPLAPECYPCFDANASTFYATQIARGSVVWFNAVVYMGGQPSGTQLRFSASAITLTHGLSTTSITVPGSLIVVTSSVSLLTTTFDTSAGIWRTLVPAWYAGNIFLDAYPWVVPSNFDPTSSNPATWGGLFTSNATLTVQWKWAAAVYTTTPKSFPTVPANYNLIGVKPSDDTTDVFNNSDHAGTPEYFKAQVISGARGYGGTNYTGSYGATDYADPCPFLPDVGIVKTVTPSQGAPGDPITYTLKFSNGSDVLATNVVITDLLPASISAPINITNTGAIITLTSGSHYVWNVQNLNPGYGGTITITGFLSRTLRDGAVITNTAIISALNDSVLINNTSTVTTPVKAYPDLGVGITDNVLIVNPVQLLNYVVPYTNTGNYTATGSVITVSVPVTLTNFVPGNGGVYNNYVITWNIGTVAAGASGVVTFTAVVSPDATTGTFTALAYIHDDYTRGADPTPPDNVATDTDIILQKPTGIDMVYFTVAAVHGRDVQLRWAPVFGASCSFFTISRSGSTDVRSAVAVASVPASLLGNRFESYSYTDQAPAAGSWWYWVTCTAGDGSQGDALMSAAPANALNLYYLPVMSR